jgi:eukaryotic-like serine/threonine-protein kinase
MRLYAVAARRRLGEMIGGDRGRQLIAETEEWMSKQQIKNPARMINLIAPGF